MRRSLTRTSACGQAERDCSSASEARQEMIGEWNVVTSSIGGGRSKRKVELLLLPIDPGVRRGSSTTAAENTVARDGASLAVPTSRAPRRRSTHVHAASYVRRAHEPSLRSGHAGTLSVGHAGDDRDAMGGRGLSVVSPGGTRWCWGSGAPAMATLLSTRRVLAGPCDRCTRRENRRPGSPGRPEPPGFGATSSSQDFASTVRTS